MLSYVLQVLFGQLLFLGIFMLALRNETYFKANRVYLLLSVLIPFVLPYIELDVFVKTAEPFRNVVLLPELNLTTNNASEASNSFNLNVLVVLYGIVSSVLLVLLCRKLFSIIITVRQNHKTIENNVTVVNLDETNHAFSFLNYVFLGSNIQHENREQIFNHELVHVKQKHSLDILLIEILLVFFWFNPLLYIYKKLIQENHEYLADRYSVNRAHIPAYVNGLLAHAFQTPNYILANHFFKSSLIKKRIIMLNKKQSKSSSALKYVLGVPVVLSMLFMASCNNEDSEQISTQEKMTQAEKDRTIKEKVDKVVRNINANRDTEVPFSVIEQVPSYPDCDLSENKAKGKCVSDKIQKFIQNEFDTGLATDLGLSGRQRISVLFKIDKGGNVVEVQARAPHPRLAKEAKRVINKLPKMEPGKHNGKTVTVPYSLPIVFQVSG